MRGDVRRSLRLASSGHDCFRANYVTRARAVFADIFLEYLHRSWRIGQPRCRFPKGSIFEWHWLASLGLQWIANLVRNCCRYPVRTRAAAARNPSVRILVAWRNESLPVVILGNVVAVFLQVVLIEDVLVVVDIVQILEKGRPGGCQRRSRR